MITKTEFIKRATEKFKDKFEFVALPEQIDRQETTTIKVICPTHGQFEPKVKNFLDSKYGCPKCAKYALSHKERKLENRVIEKCSRPDIHPISNPIITDSKHVIGTVYCFLNKINNKVYIGKVIRNDYTLRFNEHRSQTTSNCVYFYRAINKYGWDNFDKFILFQTDVKESTPEFKVELNKIIKEKEKEYIALYKSNNSKYGYNLTIGGDGITGVIFSEESRKKCSIAHSGKNHWNYGKFNSAGKAVLQYDLNGKFVKRWNSMAEVERAGIAKSSNISECCNGKLNSIGNFIWVKETDKVDNMEEKVLKARMKSNDKIVMEFDLEGNLLNQFISAAEAARTYNCDGSTISGAAKGKFDWGLRKIWIYKKDFTPELLQIKIEKIKKKRNNKLE